MWIIFFYSVMTVIAIKGRNNQLQYWRIEATRAVDASLTRYHLLRRDRRYLLLVRNHIEFVPLHSNLRKFLPLTFDVNSLKVTLIPNIHISQSNKKYGRLISVFSVILQEKINAKSKWSNLLAIFKKNVTCKHAEKGA